MAFRYFKELVLGLHVGRPAMAEPANTEDNPACHSYPVGTHGSAVQGLGLRLRYHREGGVVGGEGGEYSPWYGRKWAMCA